MELNRPDDPSPETADSTAARAAFTIVGVGASAGGLKAFAEFFAGLPGAPGMAFVLVQHLAPDHESELAELLQNHTALRVIQVEDGVRAEPGSVYVIPPGKALSIRDGVLRLDEPARPHGHRAPIDDFFRSLAADQGERAVAVVLSGTGSDGTLGLKKLKEVGGLTAAQDPTDAEYDGMPRSAVGTGLVDVVLPARELGGRLVELRQRGQPLPPLPESLSEPDSEALAQIFARLRAGTGHDFSRYKQTTVLRRIGRRMQVTGAADLRAYARALRTAPREVEALLQDLLISVTNFFRDPEAFAALEREVIPAMFAGKRAGAQVRVWVPGCATGEEAYAIAILLSEYAARLDAPPALQVFATDIDEGALAFARAGVYPETIAADVSPDRLERFFEREAGAYRVSEHLRERVLFASHNLLKDPPFSNLDLVSCRNLLIYLQRGTQQRIFELFAYALRTPGFLFLGTSESVEGTRDFFTTLDKKQRLFRARGVAPRPRFPITPSLPATPLREPAEPPEAPVPEPPPASLDDLHQRLLLAHHVPPSVLVNPRHEILHVAGDVSRYLAFAPGRPTSDLLKVVRTGLRPELRTALFHAAERGRTTERLRIRTRLDGEPAHVVLTVRPLGERDGAEGLVQVVFEEEPVAVEATPPTDGAAPPALEPLEAELERTKARLQSTIEEYETSNEELKASNEELLSMNEELQSTSEELETGREELQSVNEELVTVNHELKTKIEELGHTNADLKNLIDSTDVATLFLDRDLRITRSTPRLRELFNVLPTDRGRPIGHLTRNVAYPAFIDDARRVLETLDAVEREVEADDGRRFLTRIVPYRTAAEQVDGVVATFLDISRRVEAEETANRREARFRRVIADAPFPILLHAEDGEILQISRALTELSGYAPEDIPTLDAWTERAYGERAVSVAGHIDRLYALDTRVEEGEYRVRTKDGEERVWQFSSSPVGTDGQGRRLVVSMAADVTERKLAEDALRANKQRLRLAVDAAEMGTWDLDVRTGEAVRSPRHDAIFGYAEPLPAWTYEQFLDHVHPDDRDSISQSFDAAIAAGTEWHFEGRIHRADGALRWIWARGVPHRDESGEVARFVGGIIDITKRKEAEAVREVEAGRQTALAAFGLYALTETDTQALFDRAVAVVHEALGADFTKVLELQPASADGEATLLLRSGIGWQPGLTGTATVPTDAGSQGGYTLTVDQPVLVGDMDRETRFQGPALLTDHGVASGVSVVIGGLDAPFGVFGTHSRTPEAFDAADARFLQSVANAVASAVDRIEAIDHLEERVAARTRTLRESEARLRLLYDVISQPADDVGEQIDRALHLTTDLLGLDVGILSHIEGDTYTVERCYAPGTGLEPGQTFAVGETPCAITLTGEKPLMIGQLSASAHRGHPCRDAFDIECYAGAPVRVGGAVRGTLNFTSATPRAEPFSDGDRELVALLAQWVGTALEREAAEDALREQKAWSELLIESSHDGILAIDTAHRYTAWNAGMERISGLGRDDVLGRVAAEVFPFLEESGETIYQQAALDGKHLTSQNRPYTIPETGRSGFYEARYTPLRNAEGAVVGGLGVVRDVTEQKRAQEQIEQSEQLLAGVLLSSLDGITAFEALRGADGQIEDLVWLVANPAAAALARQNAADLLGARLSETLPGIRASGYFDDFVGVIETGKPSRGLRYYTAGPVKGWFEHTAVKLGDGLTVTIRDVTEQKEAERALRESEERFRGLFEGSPDAIFVESLDGVVLDVNPAAARLHNTTREWLIGRDLGELVPPAYRERAQADFERLARGDTSLLESHSYTADGLVVPVEVRTDRVTYGGQEALLLHVRDVAERDAAERALRESEERFAKAFHAAPVAMTISTFHENRFLDVNGSYCALTGFSRDELLGRTAEELGIMPDGTPAIPHAAQLETTGSASAVEFVIHTKDGVLRDVLVSAELIEISGLTCILGIGFDVTERKRLEREVIEAAELERRRIGQDLHDELGQQLTGAAFLGQVLTQRLTAGDRPEADAASQLTDLINRALAEMRDLSRLLSPVDVQAEGLMDALQQLADQTERVFDVACWLRTDGDVGVADNVAATHLFRIAQEAVNNAVKHAAPSEIEIALARSGEGLRLTITDDGIGIDPAMIQQSSGLGLRTMRYRAALIGARLDIEPGEHGSVVAVLLADADG
ncbi:MAG: PAS domain S-box protein [Rhodothermales bacterium]